MGTAAVDPVLVPRQRVHKGLDEEAKGAPLMFRLLIIPASTVLWIYLLKKVREKKLSVGKAEKS